MLCSSTPEPDDLAAHMDSFMQGKIPYRATHRMPSPTGNDNSSWDALLDLVRATVRQRQCVHAVESNGREH